MKRLFIMAIPLFLAHCSAPEDVAYCESLGVSPEHSEYENCLNYHARQEAAYNADYQQCAFEADKTYPPTLYDRGRRVYTGGLGYGGFGYGGFGSHRYGGFDWVGPDIGHNAHVDALRDRIIAPCMQARGWRNPHDWTAGRTQAPSKERPSSTPLPWRK
jgi:hypothetical protein